MSSIKQKIQSNGLMLKWCEWLMESVVQQNSQNYPLSGLQLKSRLGVLLVKRQYISIEQLHRAVAIQQERDIRLGELLIEQGLISQKQLKIVLRRQNWLRLLAAAIAMIITPFTPVMAANYGKVGNSPLPINTHALDSAMPRLINHGNTNLIFGVDNLLSQTDFSQINLLQANPLQTNPLQSGLLQKDLPQTETPLSHGSGYITQSQSQLSQISGGLCTSHVGDGIYRIKASGSGEKGEFVLTHPNYGQLAYSVAYQHHSDAFEPLELKTPSRRFEHSITSKNSIITLPDNQLSNTSNNKMNSCENHTLDRLKVSLRSPKIALKQKNYTGYLVVTIVPE
ncbi:hypothetical protein [Aliikangiella maris]|uniref:Uncharacterized protein n=2 Tax=Aliikangiella maris TaxID=3162458 RepID=A0ABV2BX86_9GAMM